MSDASDFRVSWNSEFVQPTDASPSFCETTNYFAFVMFTYSFKTNSKTHFDQNIKTRYPPITKSWAVITITILALTRDTKLRWTRYRSINTTTSNAHTRSVGGEQGWSVCIMYARVRTRG